MTPRLVAETGTQGVNVALGPVTGGPMGRSPLGGRGWENFSPDPYLTGEGSYWSVKGLQVS